MHDQPGVQSGMWLELLATQLGRTANVGRPKCATAHAWSGEASPTQGCRGRRRAALLRPYRAYVRASELWHTRRVRDPYFPFHALNLRSNPFRALTDEEWAEVVVLPHALEAAEEGGGHLQVLGELGRGKTSALLGLTAGWRRGGRRVAYEYLPEGRRVFKTQVAGLELLALDEAQRLSRRERERLLRAAEAGLRLALGSHEDFAAAFAARGWPLTTVRLDAPDAAHLGRILARRLEYFAFDPARPGMTISDGAVAALHAAYGSNRRAIERCLYEVFQAVNVVGEVSAAQVEAARAGRVIE